MSEIRSVSVHLDADVAGYIAKMKLAADATDKAFGSNTSRKIGSTNTSLGQTDTRLRNVDTSARKAQTSVSGLERTMSRAGGNGGGFSRGASTLDDFAKKLGILPGLAVAGSAALIPLGAAAAGVIAAFAAPIAFVGGGLTLFGILDAFAVKRTNEQLKGIDKLQTQLDGLTKGTKEYAQVQSQLKNAQAAITPAQQQYADSLDHLKGSFDHLIGKDGDALIGPLSKGINLAADLLPRTTPIITAVSGGLTTLLGDLDRFSKTNEFSAFVHDVSSQIGPDLVAGGHILGDFTEGIGHLLVLTGKKLSPELLHGLENIGQDFSDWASSKGARRDVQSFLQYLHEVGPDVASTIDSVAHGLAATTRALAPLGPPTLHVVQGIADAISGIPTPVLTALAGATIGLSVLSKTGGLKAVSGGVNRLTGGAGIAGGLIGASRPVPVFVTNPGFGKGGPGGGGVLATGGKVAAGAKAIDFGVEAGVAAKVAGDLVKAAGGGPEAQAAAAGKAFKDAIAASAKISEAAAARAFTFGKIGGAAGLLRTVLGAPLPALGSQAGSHAVQGGTSPNVGTQFVIPPSGKLPTSIKPDVRSTTTAMQGLEAEAAKASRELEKIGPRADASFGRATHSAVSLNHEVASIKGTHAEQEFDRISGSARSSLGTAGGAVDGFKGKLNSIPTNKKVQVNAETGQALGQIQSVRAAIAGIDRVVNVHVNVTRNTNALLADVNTPKPHAGGGTVAGARYPYGDKVLIAAAPGEEVISNRHGQADRFRPFLKRINAMANGGTVPTHVTTTPAGSHMTDGVRHELHQLQGSLHDATTELNKERAARQALIQQRQQLVSTVQGNFRTDIFAQPTSPWMTAAGPLATLRTDIRNARQYRTQIGRLRRRGLSGGALGEVDTLADAETIRHYTPHQLHLLDQLYQERQHVSHAAGTTLGDARFGKQIERATRAQESTAGTVHHLEGQLKQANQHLAAIKKEQAQQAAKLANALNGATSTAARRART